MAAFSTLLIFILISGAIAAAIYFVGLPAEWKEEIQKFVMTRAAEGQAKDMLSDQINKLPEANRDQVDGLSSGIEQLTGGRANIKNPLGGLLGGQED